MLGFRTLYLLSTLLLFIADRILGTEHSFYFPLIGLSFVSIGLGIRALHTQTKLIWVSTLGLLIPLGYALWWLGGVNGQLWLDVSEDNLLKWQAFFQSLGALCFGISLVPILALHLLLEQGTQHILPHKVSHHTRLWLGTTMALLSLLPINYIAQDTNQRWDLGYFKTATPGDSSMGLVQNLAEPVTAYLFFQLGMDVTEEVRSYFDQLPTNNLEIRYVDKDLEPTLAKELSVQQNGIIVLAKGAADNRSMQRIQIGKTLSSAKRNLKKLDEEFREALLKLTQSSNTLYFTGGHGEFYWKVEEEDDESRKIGMLKRGLSTSNFAIKELSIANGLANEIPEDASAVVILAPQTEFSEAEVQTIVNYWNQGKSLFIALEPDGADLSPLLTQLNLQLDTTPLTHSSIYMPTEARALPIHKRNIITNKFSTHSAVTTLSRYNKVMQLVFANSGSLTPLSDDIKVTTIIKSLESTWKDANDNYLQEENEADGLWSIAVAVEKTIESTSDTAKAVVFADASWLTDNYLGKSLKVGQQAIQPHAITLSDTLFWLTDQKEASGTVNNENDVKIQHSKGEQGWIFLATSTMVPLLLFVIGRWRIRRRAKGGQ